MRPKSGEMQVVYKRFGRFDLAKCDSSGWWVTIWRCRPPTSDMRYQVLAERWHWSFVRVVYRYRLVIVA